MFLLLLVLSYLDIVISALIVLLGPILPFVMDCELLKAHLLVWQHPLLATLRRGQHTKATLQSSYQSLALR